jgi:DNA-binding MarR family transcriptional regulator
MHPADEMARKSLPFAVSRDPAIEKAVAALTEAMSQVRLCDELSQKLFGVTAAQLRLLCALVDNGRQTVNELADSMAVHQSSASALIVTLARRGLVIKAGTISDGRTAEVSITAKGRQVADRSKTAGRPLLNAALAEMPHATVTQLARSLSRLAKEMKSKKAEVERTR